MALANWRTRTNLSTQSPQVIAHIKSSIADQLDILLGHIAAGKEISPLFVRNHALEIVHLAEVLIEPQERLILPNANEPHRKTDLDV